MSEIAGPIFIAGHRGLVGSALVRKCKARGLRVLTRARQELDLRDGAEVTRFVPKRSQGW